MNCCILIFLIIFLIIIFFIIIGFCITNKESFTALSPIYQDQAIKNIRKQITSFNPGAFSIDLLRDYHQKSIETTLLVNINEEGNYTINHANNLKGSDKLIAFIILMKKLKKKYKKLPKCTFVQTFADRQHQTQVCILENSALKTDNAVLSPFWYFLSKSKVDQVKNKNLSWVDKKPVAIWRGASTGFAMNDYRTGQRISRKYTVDKSKQFPGLIDAKFVTFPDKGKELAKTYEKSEFMGPLDQLKYKYIISMDGNGGTYGLYWVLSSGSCCLNNAQYKQWFSEFFQKDKHYIEFDDSKENSNLEKVIQTIKNDDNRTLRIAINAKETSKNIFNEEFVLFYMYELLKFYAERQDRF